MWTLQVMMCSGFRIYESQRLWKLGSEYTISVCSFPVEQVHRRLMSADGVRFESSF